MYIDVTIKPEVGETAYCYGSIRAIGGYPHMETIIGVLDKVSDNFIKFEDNNIKYPIYRCIWFTFGGIEVRNERYDTKKITRDNDLMIKKLRKDGKIHV